jgi:pyrroloquinoline quinone biosynthesis protein D
MMTGLSAGSVPHLPRGVRVHHDTIRNTHLLLAPERAFDLDEIALEVLRLVDGQRSIREEVIEADVIEMLNGLANRRIVGANPVGPDRTP